MDGGENKYLAFVACRRRDLKHADWLRRALRRFPLPADAAGDGDPSARSAGATRLRELFIDRGEIGHEDYLGEQIYQTLDQSERLIIICTPGARDSAWLRSTLAHFQSGHGDRRLLYWIAGDVDEWSDSGSGDFEAFLPGAGRSRHDPAASRPPDGEQRRESAPLLFDARIKPQGRERALCQLVAALTGRPLRVLLPWARRQRRRRLAWRGALLAALIGGCLLPPLLLYFNQRREKLRGDYRYGISIIEQQRRDRRDDLALATLWGAPAAHRGWEWGWFARQLFRQQAALRGHTGLVNSLAYLPDGRTLLSAGYDGRVLIWNTVTGERIGALDGHEASVNLVRCNRAGSQALTVSDDRTGIVWDLLRRLPLLILAGRHEAQIRYAEWSPDETRIVTAGADARAVVWDADSGAALAELTGHTMQLRKAVFSPDGSRVLTAALDNTAKIWEAVSGDCLHTLEGHNGWVWDARFDAGGERIVTAAGDGTLKIWDARNGALQSTLEGHQGAVYCAWFSTDGATIVSCSHDRTIRLWNADSGELLHQLTGHTDDVWQVFEISDPRRLVSFSRDRSVRFWNPETGAPITTFWGHTDSVGDAAYSPILDQLASAAGRAAIVWLPEYHQPVFTIGGPDAALLERYHDPDNLLAPSSAPLIVSGDFSPDGRTLLVASRYQGMELYDYRTGRKLQSYPAEHRHWLVTARFSPDGKKFVTSSRDRTAIIRDVATGERLRVLSGHGDELWLADFSPNGKWVFTVGYSRRAVVWDAETGTIAFAAESPRQGFRELIFYAAFDPRSRLLLTLGNAGALHLWNIASGKREKVQPGHINRVTFAHFNRDGSRIISASEDQTARIWSSSQGKTLKILRGHQGTVHQIRYNHTENRVVTASADRTARVWDAQSGALLLILAGHADEVFDALFSPDDRRIVTTSFDGTARVWDAQTGAELLILRGHQGKLRHAAFSPDCLTLATSADDGRLLLWNAAPWNDDADRAAHAANPPAPTAGANGAATAAPADRAPRCEREYGGWPNRLRQWNRQFLPPQDY